MDKKLNYSILLLSSLLYSLKCGSSDRENDTHYAQIHADRLIHTDS